ncbi:cytochrome P450 [Actinomycetospora termitidis]|uniref:Cytochrome P450 n=1 Tax=Actinomycetospora termitidis TaxID=3053470 RepID=A0ABT7MCD5_9PSEU|nr:cytochrome P450 [Actinomycetospora sp. Odt1-22]MDL5158126.1 cytochrome P450 [Actinomycetospora sp. Odt1-22]
MSTDQTTDVPPRLGLRRDGLDPAPEVTSVREAHGTCPVTTLVGHTATLVAGYAEARTVHGDPAFGFDGLPLPPGGLDADEMARRRAGMLLALDPPVHTRLRRMLTGRFTVRAMKALEPRVVAIVDDALEAMAAGGPPADLVADFALPVPSLVICELLGVPYEDRDGFQERAERTLRSDLSVEERTRLFAESREYMASLVARARRDPGEDLLGLLVREHGDRPAAEGGIDDDEMVGLANLLLVAGHETTSNVIALGTYELLRDPEQMAAMRAALDDDAATSRAVEEMLRHVTPVSAGFPRAATQDVEVGPHVISAGTVVTASLCAANRDPALGEGLDHLDVRRDPLPHVAFGYGIHHCLGAPLARIELRIAFQAILRRFPGLALATDPDAVEFRHENLIHGVEALPVTW